MGISCAIEVASDVWRITTPLPFRPRSVHAYLVRLAPGRWALVDGGVNTPDAWCALDAGVREVAGTWAAVRVHLVTHMHLDHLGLVGRVREAVPASLAMGRLDAERAAHAAAHPGEEAEYRARLLAENGVEGAVGRELEDARAEAEPLAGFVPADELLPTGTTPLPGAAGWLAVWTPGHTAGHTALFRPGDGVLIGGDAVLPRVTPTLGVNRQRPDPVGDHLATLDRVERLEPVVLLPGHGDPLPDVGARIRELRDQTRAETGRVAALLDATPATAWELARRRYAGRDLPPSALFQALRETRAHLDHLVASGAASSGRTGKTVRFWHS